MDYEVLNTIHSGMEYLNSLLAFLIAYYAYTRYKEIKSAFNIVWFWAFMAVGVGDFIQATGALAEPSLCEYWATWFGVLNRILLATLLAGAMFGAWHRIPKNAKFWIPTVVMCLTVFLIWCSFYVKCEAINLDSYLVRPIDGSLAITWFILFLCFLFIPSACVQMPGSFKIFLLLGMFSHVVFAVGSKHALDPAFFLAHVIKLAEYSTLALACVCEEFAAKHMNGNGYVKLMESKGASLQELANVRSVCQEIKGRWSAFNG